MTCRELVEFLHDYVSDELPPTERARFDEHLDECPDCQRYLASYRTTIAHARDAHARDAHADTIDDLAAAMPEELVQAILATRVR